MQGSLHSIKVYRKHHFTTSGGIQNYLQLSVIIRKITRATEETSVHQAEKYNHIQYNANVIYVILAYLQLTQVLISIVEYFLIMVFVTASLASFPGPAQLSITYSMEKWVEGLIT